jgi:hypothetical protein
VKDPTKDQDLECDQADADCEDEDDILTRILHFSMLVEHSKYKKFFNIEGITKCIIPTSVKWM